MEKNVRRIMVSIPSEIANQINEVKKADFYDRSYAELYRYILALGLEKIQEISQPE